MTKLLMLTPQALLLVSVSLLCLCGDAVFAFAPFVNHAASFSSRCSIAATAELHVASGSDDNGNGGGAEDEAVVDDALPESGHFSCTSSSCSGLGSLLPTPRRHTLRLDKFGRRVHDLADDGTSRYTKGPSDDDLGGERMKSDADATSPKFASDGGEKGQRSPSLTDILKEGERSAKELAADASSAGFGGEVHRSSDLKALLPSKKMRFMKLDKFGRRVQRMEDDGTVNIRKEPASRQRPPPQQPATESPSLAELLENGKGKGKYKGSTINNGGGMIAGKGRRSADLKELLPKQKMRFLKLDKFGRRVQRMEDDGTVNMRKEPSPVPPVGDEGETAGQELVDGPESVDYGSLRDLLPAQRAMWTILDFRGAPVEDPRRKKKNDVLNVTESDLAPESEVKGGLKDLLPQKAIWTKLNFHGASVPDERRAVVKESDGSGTFNAGIYSNLKTLLPKRTITWKKDQLLSSGSAPGMSLNPRGLREERQRAMRDEVIALVSEISDGAGSDSLTEVTGGYTNLKDLLPERRITWRKSTR